jgi:hypothetical protein
MKSGLVALSGALLATSQTLYMVGDSTMASGGGGSGTDGARMVNNLYFWLKPNLQDGANILVNILGSPSSTMPLRDVVPGVTLMKDDSPPSIIPSRRVTLLSLSLGTTMDPPRRTMDARMLSETGTTLLQP